MPVYSTVQIAAMADRSERQVQRWIQSGKLPAQHIQGNVYEVNENDLTPFLPREVVNDLVERIASLESRVHTLEATIEGLSSNAYTPQKHAPRLLHDRSGLSESTLPDGYVPIVDLIKQYSAPETSVMRHMSKHLKRGHWKTSDGRTVNNCLDAEGVEEFERRYVRE